MMPVQTGAVPVNTVPPKPGWQTSEFATTIAAAVVAVLVAVFHVQPTEAAGFGGILAAGLPTLAAVVAAGFQGLKLIHGRQVAKGQELPGSPLVAFTRDPAR